ncbi:hypothetical protein CAPTEDRAFT_192160 [Capitella teleta]|uniref:Uncharacterized protein n=1 Tax=Capitella teleta TaxID=283909 RepID=R7VH87_CAPTE|nr:hypothetical protein CAPTEDRAFT_192160 [Capitella teleta]|eukprot:ELU15065.1 hypothetical protein CAPTEDRAFT_192160 [Capitella teleta]
MGGSGLEVIWESVYAPASVVYMMTGHAYAHALRAHLLTLATLFTFMMTEMEDKTKSLSALHKAIIGQKPVDLVDEKVMQTLIEKNQQWIETEKERSRTGRLWLNYMEQVSLIKQFIYAEKTGDWALHLNSIRQMIPYFHAAGHLAYELAPSLQLSSQTGGYTSFVLRHFGNAIVVFDGYETTLSTKTTWQNRRMAKGISREIIFDGTMTTTVSQESFLANRNNKSRQIGFLRDLFKDLDVRTFQTNFDADATIVQTALTHSTDGQTVVVIGNDTDLLVMMVALATPSVNVYICDTTKGPRVFSIRAMQRSIGEILSYLLSLYALSRHYKYKQAIEKSSLTSTIKLESLPPTSAAAAQHSLRAYHQVQTWHGKMVDATAWGWQIRDGILAPVESTKGVDPENLLKIVACGCKRNVRKAAAVENLDSNAHPYVVIVKGNPAPTAWKTSDAEMYSTQVNGKSTSLPEKSLSLLPCLWSFWLGK